MRISSLKKILIVLMLVIGFPSLGFSEKKIYGGSFVQLDGSPVGFILNIRNNEIYGNCTGVLVAPDVVVTAAHCVVGKDGYGHNSSGVYIGGKWIKAAGAFYNPQYYPHLPADVVGPYDLGVLKLSSPVTNVEPLPIFVDLPLAPTPFPAFILGFGANNENQTLLSEAPKQGKAARVDVIFANSEIFSSAFSYSNTSPCPGDSGGPLMTIFGTELTPKYEGLLGITSHGEVTSTNDLCRITGDIARYVNLQSATSTNFLRAFGVRTLSGRNVLVHVTAFKHFTLLSEALSQRQPKRILKRLAREARAEIANFRVYAAASRKPGMKRAIEQLDLAREETGLVKIRRKVNVAVSHLYALVGQGVV